jgi:hypothetical protein
MVTKKTASTDWGLHGARPSLTRCSQGMIFITGVYNETPWFQRCFKNRHFSQVLKVSCILHKFKFPSTFFDYFTDHRWGAAVISRCCVPDTCQILGNIYTPYFLRIIFVTDRGDPQGSIFSKTIGSQMEVRLSALRVGRDLLPPTKIPGTHFC